MALTELNEGHDDDCHRQQCRPSQHDVGWLLWTVWIGLSHFDFFLPETFTLPECNSLLSLFCWVDDSGEPFERRYPTCFFDFVLAFIL